MKILVCISHVPDTTTKIKFDAGLKNLDKAGIQWIINPWDELALTRALELKEASGGAITAVTVINVGLVETEPTIRKALAIGADDAIRVDADPADAYMVASQIAEVVKQDAFEMIVCGIESSDYNGSAVGGMVSEFLGIPSVSSVSSILFENGNTILEREIDGGKQTLGTSLPFVAVIQKGIAKEPRIPSMRGIMSARTKPLKVVPAANPEALTEFMAYELPKPREACKMVAPENVGDLVKMLHEEAKVI
ncbi:MAG: electron transfer flavoprotein subunit beta/FixA family protein [Bacteroidota bacterium]